MKQVTKSIEARKKDAIMIYSYRTIETNSVMQNRNKGESQQEKKPQSKEAAVGGCITVKVKKAPYKINSLSRRLASFQKNKVQDYNVVLEPYVRTQDDLSGNQVSSARHVRQPQSVKKQRIAAFSIRAHSTDSSLVPPQVKGVKISKQPVVVVAAAATQDRITSKEVMKTTNQLQTIEQNQNGEIMSGYSRASNKDISNRDIEDTAAYLSPLYKEPELLQVHDDNNKLQPLFKPQEQSLIIRRKPRRIGRFPTQNRVVSQSDEDKDTHNVQVKIVSIERQNQQLSSIETDDAKHDSGIRVSSAIETPRNRLQCSNQDLHHDIKYDSDERNKEICQQLQILTAEQLIEQQTELNQVEVQSNHHSHHYLSVVSYDGDTGAKVTDYNTSSPSVLLPKLHRQSVAVPERGTDPKISQFGERNQSIRRSRHTELAAAKSTAEPRSNQKEVGNQCWLQPILVNAVGPNAQIQPFIVTQGIGHDRGKILIQKNQQYSANNSAGSGPDNVCSNSESAHQLKSRKHKKSMLCLPNKCQIQQPSGGFKVIAERKDVVQNTWAVQMNCTRKRNTISNYELKRQQKFFNQLARKTIASSSPEKDKATGRSDDKKSPQDSDSKQLISKTVQSDEEVNIEELCSNEMLVSDQTKLRSDSGILTPEKTSMKSRLAIQEDEVVIQTRNLGKMKKQHLSLMSTEPLVPIKEQNLKDRANQDIVLQLAQTRLDDQAATTAKDNDSISASQGGYELSQRSQRILQKITQWGHNCIQIGSSDILKDENKRLQELRRTNTQSRGVSSSKVTSNEDGNCLIVRPAMKNKQKILEQTTPNWKQRSGKLIDNTGAMAPGSQHQTSVITSPLISTEFMEESTQQMKLSDLIKPRGALIKPNTAEVYSYPNKTGMNQTNLKQTTGLNGSSMFDYGGGGSLFEAETGDILTKNKKNHLNRSSEKASSSYYTAAKLAAGNRKTQVKDIFNLGDLRSKTLKNIKISRLNDLGGKEVGNPLGKINKLKEELEIKSKVLQSGGLHTKKLTDKHVQAKFKTDAIQDFACMLSRFNKTQGTGLADEINSSMISIQKFCSDSNILNHPESELSLSTVSSSESFEQRFQIQMTNQILDEAKTKMLEQGPCPQCAVNQEQFQVSPLMPITKLNEHGINSENDTLLDDQSVVQERQSLMMVQSNQDLKFQYSKLSVSPQQNNLPSHMNERNSSQKVFPINKYLGIKSKSHSSQKSESSGESRKKNNKDIEIDAQQFQDIFIPKKEAIISQIGDKIKQNSRFRCANCLQLGQLASDYQPGGTVPQSHRQPQAQQCFTQQQNVIKYTNNRKSQLPNNSNVDKVLQSRDGGNLEGLVSSDCEDATSRTHLDSIGIEEQREKEYSEIIYSPSQAVVGNKLQISGNQPPQQNTSRKNSTNGHQLPSIQTLPKVGGRNKISLNQVTEQNKQRKTKKESMSFSLSKDTGNFCSQEDYNALQIKPNKAQQTAPNPVISVPSVKVQKSVKKSSQLDYSQKTLKANDEQNFRLKHGIRGTSLIERRIQGITLIKHVDQSQEQKPHQDKNSANNTNLSERQAQKMIAESKIERMKSLMSLKKGKLCTKRSTLGLVPVMNNGNQTNQSTPSQSDAQNRKMNTEKSEDNDSQCDNYDQKTNSIEAFKLSKTQTEGTIACINPNRIAGGIFENMNISNSQLASQATNGYHQLEPKLFSTSLVDSKQQQIRHVIALELEDVTKLAPQTTISNQLVSGSYLVNKYTKNKKKFVDLKVHSPSFNQEDKDLHHQQKTNKAVETRDKQSDIGFMTHSALEGRIHGSRVTKQLIEQRKRGLVASQSPKVTTALAAPVADSLVQTGVSFISSQQFSMDSDRNYNAAPKKQANKAVSSTSSDHLNSGYLWSVDFAEHLDRNRSVRKISSTEKDITDCVNIQQVVKNPRQPLNIKLEEIACNKTGTLPQKTKAKTMPKNEFEIQDPTFATTDLNSDNLMYEFEDFELQNLLKPGAETASEVQTEDIQLRLRNPKYFLRFTGIQIVNVDCKSGIITDVEPLGLPMAKMANLFFLSSDQLQQVLSQSLRLTQANGQFKLVLDEEVLDQKLQNTVPRIMRDDFQSVPLQVSIFEQIQGNSNANDSCTLDQQAAAQCGELGESILKDSFNLEVLMPQLEIIVETKPKRHHRKQEPLFKTTLTHTLSGQQMISIIFQKGLFGWPDFAKDLISKRFFGFDGINQSCIATAKNRWHIVNDSFKLYKNPERLRKDARTARKYHQNMKEISKPTMQVTFTRPVFVRLVLCENDPDQTPISDKKLFLEPQKATRKTITTMVIPTKKFDFLQQTFGEKIDQGKGCLLECLEEIVELEIDCSRNIVRMAIPSWQSLEDMNIRQLSQIYFAEHKIRSEFQAENMKYNLKSHSRGGVKAILNYSNTFQQASPHNWPSSLQTKECSSTPRLHMVGAQLDMQKQLSTKSSLPTQKQPFKKLTSLMTPSAQLKKPNMSSKLQGKEALQDSTQLMSYRSCAKKKGDGKVILMINDDMQCKLNISKLQQVVQVFEYTVSRGEESLDSLKLANTYQTTNKDTLCNIFRRQSGQNNDVI